MLIFITMWWTSEKEEPFSVVWFGVCTIVPSAYYKAYQQEDWYSSVFMKEKQIGKKESRRKVEGRKCSWIIPLQDILVTGEGKGKPLLYSCLENPKKSMKRPKYRTLKDEFPRPVGAQYATRDQGGNNSRKNEETEPKRKQHPVVDVMEVKSHAVKSNIA